MSKSLKQLRILILDGDAAVVNFTCRALTRIGIAEPRPIFTAPGAMEALSEGDFDLVITSLVPPDKPVTALLEHAATLASPPQFILFEDAEANVLKVTRQLAEAHELKILGTLTKPVEVESWKYFR